MIGELFFWLSTQPFLVAGLGTVGASACLYVLRAVPDKTKHALRGLTSSTLSVHSRNDYYGHIDGYISVHVLPWTFRCYEPADRTEDEQPTYLNAGYGTGWGVWRGVVFSFSKSQERTGWGVDRSIEIRFWTRSVAKIECFVNEAIAFKRGEPRQRVYTSASGYWERMADKRLRPLYTVFANVGVIDSVVERIAHFLSSEDWYVARGIPYKLVVLLHGPPGTGKTSLIHAVASHFSLDIDYVSQLGQLGRLLGNKSNRKSVIVIEDIDTLARLARQEAAGNPDEPEEIQTLNLNGALNKVQNNPGVQLDGTSLATAGKQRRTTSSFENGIEDDALHDTLNSLDGFTTQHGIMMFITSNHPENLDHALMRPGRIDLAVEMGPLDWPAATRMFVAFYGEQNLAAWQNLAELYQPTTGAVLQAAFMADEAAAIAALKAQWFS